MTRHIVTLAANAAAIAIAAPAVAQETLVTPFDTVSTGTTNLYSGIVNVTVSGTGFSNGNLLNDAFYNVPSGTVEPSGYYQLGFGTSPLIPFDAGNAIYNSVVGGRPAYDASHVYTFQLDTGLTTPGQLFFGVTDGNFGDNGGAFRITIAAVPEPASWAMMIGGFGLVGGAMRTRRRSATVRCA